MESFQTQVPMETLFKRKTVIMYLEDFHLSNSLQICKFLRISEHFSLELKYLEIFSYMAFISCLVILVLIRSNKNGGKNIS